MPLGERAQSEAVVVLGVLLRTDAHSGRVDDSQHGRRHPLPIEGASARVAVMAAGLVILGARCSVVVATVTAAIAAGMLYGVQDIGTRGAIILGGRDGILSVVPSLWPYLLLAAATVAVLLTQRAFRAARLDYALPRWPPPNRSSASSLACSCSVIDWSSTLAHSLSKPCASPSS